MAIKFLWQGIMVSRRLANALNRCYVAKEVNGYSTFALAEEIGIPFTRDEVCSMLIRLTPTGARD